MKQPENKALMVDKVQYQIYLVAPLGSLFFFSILLFVFSSYVHETWIITVVGIFLLIIFTWLSCQPKIKPVKIYDYGILTAENKKISFRQTVVKFEDIVLIEHSIVRAMTKYGHPIHTDHLLIRDAFNRTFTSLIGSPQKFFPEMSKLVKEGRLNKNKLRSNAGWENLLNL